jgi:hypothetical protein
MVDTLALGASAARHGGSSPLLPTNKTAKAVFCLGQKKVRMTFGEDEKTLNISHGAQRVRYERCTDPVRVKIPLLPTS